MIVKDKTMRHARSDYDRFQDPAGIIPEDEPVFLVRGQDITAPTICRHWAMLAKTAGASPDIVQRVEMWADEIEQWQQANGHCKVPDMPAGA
jgi:hypothetical protein